MFSKSNSSYRRTSSLFNFDIFSTEQTLIQTMDWKVGDLIQFSKIENYQLTASITKDLVILNNCQSMLLLPESKIKEKDGSFQNSTNYFVEIIDTKNASISSASGMIISIEETHASPIMFSFSDEGASTYYNNRIFTLLMKDNIVVLWSAWLDRINKCFKVECL
jgi:hypothetical protein